MAAAAVALLSPLLTLYLVSGKFAPKPTPPHYREVWSPHNRFAAIVLLPDPKDGPNAPGIVNILSNDRDPQRRSTWRVAEFTAAPDSHPDGTKIDDIDWKDEGNVTISYQGAAPRTLLTSFNPVLVGAKGEIQYSRPVTIHFQNQAADASHQVTP
jgi:hypothetical protein